MKPIRITAKSRDHARAIWAALESYGFKNTRSFSEYEAMFPWCEWEYETYGVNSAGELASWRSAEPTHPNIDEAILSLPKVKTLKLNDEYTATVTAEGVKMLGQTFSHNTIQELARLSWQFEPTKEKTNG